MNPQNINGGIRKSRNVRDRYINRNIMVKKFKGSTPEVEANI